MGLDVAQNTFKVYTKFWPNRTVLLSIGPDTGKQRPREHAPATPTPVPVRPSWLDPDAIPTRRLRSTRRNQSSRPIPQQAAPQQQPSDSTVAVHLFLLSYSFVFVQFHFHCSIVLFFVALYSSNLYLASRLFNLNFVSVVFTTKVANKNSVV
jgi:hypothetical protein